MVTWTIILSIINFALGAPLAVQQELETSVDVDVAEGGAATSQKRTNPLDVFDDNWSTTNAADRQTTPPSPNLSNMDQLLEELGKDDIDWHFPPTSESPETGSAETVESYWQNHRPSNPGSSTGSYLDATDDSPMPPLPHPGPSEGRLLSPPGWPVNAETLSSTNHQPAPPQRPTSGPPLSPMPHPGLLEDDFPGQLGFPANPDTLSSTGHQPTPPQSPTGGSRLSGSSLPGSPVNPDTLLSTGHQPTPPQSPTGGSPLHPLLDPGSPGDRPPSPHRWLAETDPFSSTGNRPMSPQSPVVTHPSPSPDPSAILDDLLKGRIKRRVYREPYLQLGAEEPKVSNYST